MFPRRIRPFRSRWWATLFRRMCWIIIRKRRRKNSRRWKRSLWTTSRWISPARAITAGTPSSRSSFPSAKAISICSTVICWWATAPCRPSCPWMTRWRRAVRSTACSAMRISKQVPLWRTIPTAKPTSTAYRRSTFTASSRRVRILAISTSPARRLPKTRNMHSRPLPG